MGIIPFRISQKQKLQNFRTSEFQNFRISEFQNFNPVGGRRVPRAHVARSHTRAPVRTRASVWVGPSMYLRV